MSVAFATPRQRGKGEITPAAIQKLLDENNQLIQCIMDYQSKGKSAECSQYQQMLHRNLVYLATIADSNQNMQSLLPAPPTQSIPMGAGSINQSGMTQLAHGHSMAADGMVGGGAPVLHMQNQMNGQMPGPMMHQQAPVSQFNMPQGGAQHYPNQPPMTMMSQVNQANHMLGQRQIPPYRPAQQGALQQFSGQEEYYNDQFNHGQGAPESMNQQYYPDGNPQYGQQQEAYQQGPSQQQGYLAQQYTAQQGYPPQQQGYGASQGAPGQYSSYPQGQQYGGYRPPQPGPPQQQQRPYGYEQNMQ
ncbi:protein SSXT isoform X3 [Leucoraja erinacea]|uniref:protein SSXT isoform X3 n=1 Tax=Leucoraja erinaceus TaxID=7782 RepID=UPI0024584F2A|nr:protein SSXT isoform X3 [Leucoraja erinacea]